MVLLIGLLLPLSAQAQGDATSTIASIREQLLYARYEEAVSAAEALLRRGDLDAAARNEALEVLATAHLATRNDAAAETILAELYSRDPGHVIQDADASPVVQGAFQRARERQPTPVEVELVHTPPAPPERQSPQVDVELAQGASAVGEIQVHYRLAGAPRFATSVMVADGSLAQTRLPLLGPDTAAQTIEYYIVALAPSRTPLAQLGSESTPLTLSVPAAGTPLNAPIPEIPEEGAEEESSSKWWVALIVLGVAGAAVGGYFLFRGEEPTGSLGHVTLQ